MAFNKIPAFSKDLINFIISFVLLFVSVSCWTCYWWTSFLLFLPIVSSPTSTARFCHPSFGLKSSFLATLCKNKSAVEPSIRLDKIVNSPDYKILDSWVFQTFILADEQFAKPL